jgi:hypothetical protein
MLSVEELKFLADIASEATKNGKPAEAESIFSAILPFCPPPSNGPLVGLAMARLAQGYPEDSITIMTEQALKAVPDCAFTNAHLALVYSCIGDDHESEKCLGLAYQNGDDPETNEFLKKIESGRFHA